MMMVTHDVDEAIALSGRIVIMSPRPGEITEVIEVPLADEERDRNNDAFILLRKRILEALHLVITRPLPEYAI
jgi:ABC-type nitrate/sulfonate/bicarbonate transport system ATPase subunit